MHSVQTLNAQLPFHSRAAGAKGGPTGLIKGISNFKEDQQMNKHFALAVLTLAIGACGGGGGGGGGGGSDTVAGLEMPSTMEVVVADTGAGTPAGVSLNLRAVRSSLSRALTDAGTDYSTDEQKAWVHDRALEPLDMVNEILCYMDQTNADVLVNQTYVALVDTASCQRQGEQDSGGQNQSSGGGRTVSYERWVVQSTRSDNNSAQTVRIWAPESGDDGFAQTVYAELTATEGVSDTNPYGRFTMNFEGRATTGFTDPGSGTTFAAGDLLMSGTLKTVDTINNKIGFTLYNNSPWGGEQKVSVVADADLSAGVAFIGGQEYDPTASGGAGGLVDNAFALAFNASNILIQPVSSVADLASINNVDAATVEASGGACLSRSDFKRNVWRYDLYDAGTGARVAVNSGFPFIYNGSYGWAGYWGIWAENPPAGGWDGVTITKETFGSTAAPESYGLSVAPGKLTKRVKSEIPLTDLDGETFNYNKWDSVAMTSKDYKVEYDSDGQVSDGTNANYTVAGFYITHDVQYQQDGPPQETALSGGPQLITFNVGGGDDPWLGMWSQSLGGSVNYDSVNNASNVTFYEETFVDGNDTAFGSGNTITLNCYTECLKPELTVAQYTDQNYPSTAFYADAADGTSPVPAAVYSFDKSTLTLTVVEPAADVGKVVSLAETYTYPGSGFEPWGIGSGALVPAGSTVMDKWDTWNQAVSYRWETGHQDWNKVVIVTDSSGSVVSFDPPLSFSYQHASTKDANDGTSGAGTAFYGKTFLLEYAGNGDLWGVPWIDDGSGNYSRPAFAIADGTLMGPNDTEYAIKAREMELKPAAAPGACSVTGGLVLNQPAAPLPSAIEGSPSNGGTSEPTVDDESPATVGGVVQGT